MKNGLSAAGVQLLSRLLHRLEHHPKQATALIAALLLGGGGGAFAVASLQPEPVNVTVRQILESVQPLPIADQVQALDVHTFNLFRTDTTRSSDTVESLLARLGIDDLPAASYLRDEPVFRSQFLGRAGRSVTAEATDKHGLLRLSARWVPVDNGTFKRLVIERAADGRFASRIETAPLVAATRMGSATIRSSLFGAADEARIPDKIVAQIIDIFSGDIDFHRALHAGDRFSVVYEALEADGEPMSTGRVLSVQFVNRGQTHEAMWFQEPGNKGGYYSLDGKSVDTSYLASPVEFSRVTSGFAMRFHPVLHRWKAHLGVDYGGDVGTAVRSVGDGVVEFAGEQNGFGNVVIIRHNTTDETVYAHLSRIDVQPGHNVVQGQNVGAIGQTGWATGPHLHFEFRVNGVHRDPTAIAKNSGPATLTAAGKPEFDRLARVMRLQLQAAGESAVTASAE